MCTRIDSESIQKACKRNEKSFTINVKINLYQDNFLYDMDKSSAHKD